MSYSAPERFNRGGCLCSRVFLCGALLRMAVITPSSPAFLCLPKGLLWQAWSCHPVVLAVCKLSACWNPPGDMGWCQTIMYSFCSSTLKVQLILAVSLPICNTAWGDFPSLCVMWQAELETETFLSLILWINAVSKELGLFIAQPHLLMSSYNQTRVSHAPVPSTWVLFFPRQPQAFWVPFWEIWVHMGFKTWKNGGCSAEELVLLLPEKCHSLSSGGSLKVMSFSSDFAGRC